MRRTPQSGFTLIELLVVLAIVSILATIGIMSMQNSRQDARDAKRYADFSALRAALELYLSTYGSFPAPVASSGAGPDVSLVGTSGTIFSETDNPLVPHFLNAHLHDPINTPETGLYYYYDTNESPTVNHRNYVLCFQQEAKQGTWFYYYSTGVSGEGNVCPTLPAT